MSEQLIIRLASEANQLIHWLVWSESEKEIIGSGQVENAQALKQLSEKAQSRKVICLLPSVEVTLKSVKIEGALTRQMQRALPYMLEDDLASDVDKLHFSILAKEAGVVQVAICAKNKLQAWLEWLKEAEIEVIRFVPEVLALPIPDENKWSAIQLDQHWMIRESDSYGWGCESEMLNTILQLRLLENPEQMIESYSVPPEKNNTNWQFVDAILPMQLLAEGCIKNKINILTGEFKVKKESSLHMQKWKSPAIAVVVLLVVILAKLFIQNHHVEQQTLQVKKQIEEMYKQAFPGQRALKYTRIKKKIKGLLKETSGGNTESDFLVILNDLQPVFQADPSLKISTLKFKSEKKEIDFSVSADSFQAFEKIEKSIPDNYQLEQGALSNNKNRVSGILKVRVK